MFFLNSNGLSTALILMLYGQNVDEIWVSSPAKRKQGWRTKSMSPPVREVPTPLDVSKEILASLVPY